MHCDVCTERGEDKGEFCSVYHLLEGHTHVENSLGNEGIGWKHYDYATACD